MENLSLKDRRRRQSIAFASKPDSYDRYFARLPTPEESTPSHRSSDDERRNKVTRRHSPDHPIQSHSSGHSRPREDMYFGQGTSQRHVPDSPPYQASDSQKPSLPPLKTILASSLTSPPRSPTFHCTSVQPSPQEPAYTSATYKPPALYPQKKQRTEYLLEPVPPITTSDHPTSPLFKPEFDRRAYGAPPVSPRTRANDSRRQSLQPYSNYHPTSPRSSQRPAPPFFAERSPSNAAPIQPPPPRQTHSTTTSPTAYRDPQARHSVAYRTSPHTGFDRSFERRDSTQAPYDPIRSDHEVEYDRRPPPYPRAAPNVDYDHSQYIGRVDAPPKEAQYGPYPAGGQQPSFFMPSQYDYRHGRTRKRCNLPKQSTEIMKTWFDQNISNPYPSEEQKAIFSSATGISMTQVSNWFINHRRRCPELRDKRERTRGRDSDI